MPGIGRLYLGPVEGTNQTAGIFYRLEFTPIKIYPKTIPFNLVHYLLFLYRFSDVYDRDNVKAALLHPFFKSTDFLESSDAPIDLKEKMLRELRDEILYIQEGQRESMSADEQSISSSTSYQTVNSLTKSFHILFKGVVIPHLFLFYRMSCHRISNVQSKRPKQILHLSFL